MADLVGFDLFDDYLNEVQESQQPAGAAVTCPTEQESQWHGILDVQSVSARASVRVHSTHAPS